MNLLIVGLGGFLGAVARYGLSGLAQRSIPGEFPVGTLAVNVLGCLVIGSLMALVEYRQLFTPQTRLFLTIGFLGSFTTFSTFGYETLALLREEQYLAAGGNVVSNLVLGLLGVWGGWLLVKLTVA